MSSAKSGILKKTNESVAYRFSFKILQRGVALVFSVILARLLSPAEFGIVAIARMVITYANNFTNFGFNTALVQKDRIQSAHVNSVFTFNLTVSVLLALLTAGFADQLAVFFNNKAVGPVLRWMSLYYIITTFYYIPVAILKRDIRSKTISVVEFVQGILTSVFAIILALNHFSYWSIVIPALIMPVFSLAIYMRKTRWMPRLMFKHEVMKDIYSFGFWNFIRNQLNLLVAKVDYFVIAKYLNVASLGIYEKAFEFTNRTLSGVTKPISSIYFSTFSRLQNDKQSLKEVLFQGISLLATVTYPLLFGIIVVAPYFVYGLLGDRWALSIVPMQILAAAGVFRVLIGLMTSANVAVGEYKVQTQFNMVNSIIFVVLCFTLVSRGILAITWAFFAFSVIGFLFSFFILRRTLNLKFRELASSFLYPLLGSLLMAGIDLGLARTVLTDTHSVVHFALLVGAGVSFYAVWAFVLYKKGKITLKLKG